MDTWQIALSAVGSFAAMGFIFWRVLDARFKGLETDAKECAADRRAAAEHRAEMRAEMKHVRADVSRALTDGD